MPLDAPRSHRTASLQPYGVGMTEDAWFSDAKESDIVKLSLSAEVRGPT
jgi:hypothetical protein